jgi:cobalt/nickel transport protein
MERKYLKAIAALFVVFAIGLVGFYTFSAMYGDGLEKVMQDGGASEGDPAWTAPLDYGDGYGGSLMMGIIGFFVVMVVFVGLYLLVRSRKKTGNSH